MGQLAARRPVVRLVLPRHAARAYLDSRGGRSGRAREFLFWLGATFIFTMKRFLMNSTLFRAPSLRSLAVAISISWCCCGERAISAPPGYPKTSLAVGYQVVPDWPQKPAD